MLYKTTLQVAMLLQISPSLCTAEATSPLGAPQCELPTMCSSLEMEPSNASASTSVSRWLEQDGGATKRRIPQQSQSGGWMKKSVAYNGPGRAPHVSNETPSQSSGTITPIGSQHASNVSEPQGPEQNDEESKKHRRSSSRVSWSDDSKVFDGPGSPKAAGETKSRRTSRLIETAVANASKATIANGVQADLGMPDLATSTLCTGNKTSMAPSDMQLPSEVTCTNVQSDSEASMSDVQQSNTEAAEFSFFEALSCPETLDNKGELHKEDDSSDDDDLDLVEDGSTHAWLTVPRLRTPIKGHSKGHRLLSTPPPPGWIRRLQFDARSKARSKLNPN